MNVICWSGGKDSTATIILAHIHNIPIDRIVFAEVMFSHKDNISGENPEHIKWIKEVAIPKLNDWGYVVDVVKSKEDYLSYFWLKHQGRGKHPERKGNFYGWFMPQGCWGNSHLKVEPMDKYFRQFKEYTKIVGIAIDEPKRLERAYSKNQRSLLAEYGMTEENAKALCKEYGLLSPIYANGISRSGCWFCPNSTIKEMAKIKGGHPELWDEIKKLAEYFQHHVDQFAYGYKINFLRGKAFSEVERKVDEFLAEQASKISLF